MKFVLSFRAKTRNLDIQKNEIRLNKMTAPEIFIVQKAREKSEEEVESNLA